MYGILMLRAMAIILELTSLKMRNQDTKGTESEPRRSLVLVDNEAIVAYIEMAILQYDENSSLWSLPGRAIS